jgi:hypothetical protein
MRRTIVIAVIAALVALVPASSALAQGAPTANQGVPAGQIEFTQRTVQVSGSNAVPHHERTTQYLTTHSSHVLTRTIATGKLRTESATSPRRELLYDGTKNTVRIGKGLRTPPYESLGQEARVVAQQVAQGCWTAAGDTVFEGRGATLYKLVAATSGPCRGDAQVGQAIVDKATGYVLEREAGLADGSVKSVDVLERFGTLPLNPRTAKLLKFHAHRGAKVVGDDGRKARSHYGTRGSRAGVPSASRGASSRARRWSSYRSAFERT